MEGGRKCANSPNPKNLEYQQPEERARSSRGREKREKTIALMFWLGIL